MIREEEEEAVASMFIDREKKARLVGVKLKKNKTKVANQYNQNLKSLKMKSSKKKRKLIKIFLDYRLYQDEKSYERMQSNCESGWTIPTVERSRILKSFRFVATDNSFFGRKKN